MKINRPIIIFSNILYLFFIFKIYIFPKMGLADELSLPQVHPRNTERKIQPCTTCHADDTIGQKPIRVFNHTSDWKTKHAFRGYIDRDVCQSCHQDSFCAECHMAGSSLKPSRKYADKPFLHFPHQGNYLQKHKIEGRLEPSSCYPCHGRRNNSLCRRCHKNF